MITWFKIKKELDKCVMLCCVCHRMLHAGHWETKRGWGTLQQAPHPHNGDH